MDTHVQLLALDGAYARFCKSQMLTPDEHSATRQDDAQAIAEANAA
jgi:hypothetical protein